MRVEKEVWGKQELGRGRAVWRQEVGAAIQAELAEVLLWRHRDGLTWEEFSRRMGQEVREAEKAEERGFWMLAWQLLTQVQKAWGLLRLVGAVTLVADVHFQS